MTDSSLDGLPVFLFIAGVFHFLHVVVTYVFVGSVKENGNIEGIKNSEDPFAVVTRRGLITFVLGSGIVVMLNARALAQGGRLAGSLLTLLALVFSYRFFAQLFCFSRFLRLGAHRAAHWALVLCSGYASGVYVFSTIVLFSR